MLLASLFFFFFFGRQRGFVAETSEHDPHNRPDGFFWFDHQNLHGFLSQGFAAQSLPDCQHLAAGAAQRNVTGVTRHWWTMSHLVMQLDRHSI